jgi:hypothetical protein
MSTRTTSEIGLTLTLTSLTNSMIRMPHKHQRLLLVGSGEARMGEFDPCSASRCSCLNEASASSLAYNKLIRWRIICHRLIFFTFLRLFLSPPCLICAHFTFHGSHEACHQDDRAGCDVQDNLAVWALIYFS